MHHVVDFYLTNISCVVGWLVQTIVTAAKHNTPPGFSLCVLKEAGGWITVSTGTNCVASSRIWSDFSDFLAPEQEGMAWLWARSVYVEVTDLCTPYRAECPLCVLVNNTAGFQTVFAEDCLHCWERSCFCRKFQTKHNIKNADKHIRTVSDVKNLLDPVCSTLGQLVFDM